MTSKYPSIKKLTAYLSGELSDKESEEVTNWFSQSDAGKKELNDLKIIWGLSDRLKQMEQIDKLKAKRWIDSRIKPSLNRWKLYLANFQRAAAILILPVILLSVWLLLSRSEGGNHVQREFFAAYGTRSTLLLPDGSKVWLNSGSNLRYGDDFNQDLRTVFLTGEAFFDVKADKTRPFDVVTDGFTVRAVGTEFNVRSYDDNEFETSLEEGSVQLFQSGQVATEPLLKMKPGQRALFDNGKITVSEGEVERFSAWTQGKLIFDDTPITEVADKLSRMFNVDFEVKEEIKDYNYTVTFRDDPLFQILDLMTIATPIQYKTLPRKKLPDGSYSKQKIILEKRL